MRHRIPLSLYVHIPWCIKKCPYCDFNSHQYTNNLSEEAYVQALLADLKQDVNQFGVRPLHSIFIGGGTPSLFSPTAYAQLFNGIQQLLPFDADIEITLEANPGTRDEQWFKGYREVGINRLSLGVQSFQPRHLHQLGRIHDEKQAHDSIECAYYAGFTNINIDLMYGLPDQTVQQGIADLNMALSYQPKHLSWYQLTIEPNTVFYKQQPVLPPDDALYELEEEGYALLDRHGYQRYEISAFSQSQAASLHNSNYWLFGDYFGIGAGAHGKLTLEESQIIRTNKHRQPKDYLNPNKPFLAELKTRDQQDKVFEFMLNTTRLAQLIPQTLFTSRTGLSFDMLLPSLKQAAHQEFIHLDQSSAGEWVWQVTPLGRRFNHDLQMLFLAFEKR